MTDELPNSTASAFAELTGRRIFVSGASRGIGRGIAIECARAGADVAINYRTHPDEAAEVVAEVEALGQRAVAIQADVADRDAIAAAIHDADSAIGPLDGVVSNAAYSDRKRLLNIDLEKFDRTLDVSMGGAFNILHATSKLWTEREQPGSIVIVSSPHSYIPIPTAMAYNMAKAAIEMMAKTAAIELARYRIRVNILQPGWTDTPGERNFFTEEQMQEGAKTLPWKRLGTPTEVGRMARLLLSDDADYMTGSALLVDGGVSLPWWSNRDEGGQ